MGERNATNFDDDWLEKLSAERHAADFSFAESEARVAAEGCGWVVERPVELEDGEIEWEVVTQG